VRLLGGRARGRGLTGDRERCSANDYFASEMGNGLCFADGILWLTTKSENLDLGTFRTVGLAALAVRRFEDAGLAARIVAVDKTVSVVVDSVLAFAFGPRGIGGAFELVSVLAPRVEAVDKTVTVVVEVVLAVADVAYLASSNYDMAAD
ncbi:MAG TPA: hypothetical protein VFH02_13630, partial [Jiangellaceae bacterium]|nr:hypothetical protein [Jiangellaceae bacterium]